MRRLFQRYEPDVGPLAKHDDEFFFQKKNNLATIPRLLFASDLLVGWEGLMEKWGTASSNVMDEPVHVFDTLVKRVRSDQGCILQLQGITTRSRLREVWIAYLGMS